ncbi:sulfite exporter TauE/SafE family protein [Leptothoe sp. PORK10 BA2]|uniref:sulfite exporter TauE/SafE family protein n=1 Tax=Leptothoe sp. PORK10 BA2 TaxID=3110254 RepID=UPI002B205697|nr:sulfite exporter TauE/SafE family protein [Leptothoe sp. PORK10 BA2]MEA5465337.1 sulfite exporter TauE/SafE family protein [Leptothoe sp. PORK10 BA2]
MSYLDFALFALLGIGAGTMSGMLGIGGGMIIVPGLFYLFSVIDLPSYSLMHLAAGSAMCIMIFTSASSTFSHHVRGDVQWGIFGRIIAAIGFGVVLGNVLSNHLDTDWLEIIFGLFLLAISVKILLDWKPAFEETTMPPIWVFATVGTLIGFKSGVLGIGGGAISVPFLLYCGLPMSKASGTSASFTLPIAIVGTLSFLLLSPGYGNITWSTGYIYWPAVALVAPFTMIGAPIGTQLSHIISPQQLRRIFGWLLVVIGLRMFSGGIQFLA